MKKILSAILALSVFTSSVGVVRAEDVPAVVSPVRTGQPAPFSGVLMSPKATAALIAELSGINDKVAAEIRVEKLKCEARSKFVLNESEAKHTADKKILEAEVEQKTTEAETFQRLANERAEAIKKLQDDKPSRMLWFGLGTGAGVVLTVLAVVGINQAVK